VSLAGSFASWSFVPSGRKNFNHQRHKGPTKEILERYQGESSEASPTSGLQHVRFVQCADCEAFHRALQVLADFE
jgi:hypothetical protein